MTRLLSCTYKFRLDRQYDQTQWLKWTLGSVPLGLFTYIAFQCTHRTAEAEALQASLTSSHHPMLSLVFLHNLISHRRLPRHSDPRMFLSLTKGLHQASAFLELMIHASYPLHFGASDVIRMRLLHYSGRLRVLRWK